MNSTERIIEELRKVTPVALEAMTNYTWVSNLTLFAAGGLLLMCAAWLHKQTWDDKDARVVFVVVLVVVGIVMIFAAMPGVIYPEGEVILGILRQ